MRELTNRERAPDSRALRMRSFQDPSPRRTLAALPMTPPQPATRPETDPDSGKASAAAFLTWFLPGAGHLYLGRTVTAVVVFVAIQGLYALGYWLSLGASSDGVQRSLVFLYLDPELRTAFAPVLSPELGNLGAFLYQLRLGYGDGQPQPWPEWMRLGSSLCGASGILNTVCMVHAHTLARTTFARRVESADRGPHPALVVGATWILPGLGHLLQRRVLRGVIVFGLLVGLFAWGTWLAEGANLSRERHFYYWGGQFLLGGPALLAEALWGAKRITHELPYGDAGLVFGCVAGLLNVLAMIDAYAASEVRWFDLRSEPGPEGQPPSGSTVRTVEGATS